MPALAQAGERVPAKTYTTADGIPQNNINRIAFDTRGFLWVCTDEGVARFDGYRFSRFGAEEGLPHRKVNDWLETKAGEHWLATNGGLVRFDPQSVVRQRMFTVWRPSGLREPTSFNVTALLEDRQGTIWVAANAGLLRLRRKGASFEFVPTPLWNPESREFHITALLQDRHGALWIGGAAGWVYRIGGDGVSVGEDSRFERFAQREGLPSGEVVRFYEDRSGTVWACTDSGLFALVDNPVVGQSVVQRSITNRNGLPGTRVNALWQTTEGVYWLATDRGLVSLTPGDASGLAPKIKVLNKENGLSDYYFKAVVGDPLGNLWLGTANAGLLKLMADGITTVGHDEGLTAVVAARQSRTGELFFAGYVAGSKLKDWQTASARAEASSNTLHWRLAYFEGERLAWVRPNVPRTTEFAAGWDQVVLQDRQGEWWFATNHGVYRFPSVARLKDLAAVAPKKVYTTAQGLSGNAASRLFEDARGDIWIATSALAGKGLHRWERTTDRIHNLTETAGSPSLKAVEVATFQEDRAGNLWMGFRRNSSTGGVMRYRAGRFEFFDTSGAPTSNVLDLLLDRNGMLWIGSSLEGVFFVTQPEQAAPVFQNYTTQHGLSSSRVSALAEDQQGELYFGTRQGLDCFDRTTNSFRHYTAADGLPLGNIDDLLCDQSGKIWLATTQGLARFTPSPAMAAQANAPGILIDDLRIRGERYPLSALGVQEIELHDLRPEENQLEVAVVGLNLALGGDLQYQYKLEGVDTDWQKPTAQRSINFASLSPGDYRFWARALTADGVASQTPASMRFRVLRPFWQRWWFVTLSVAGFGLLLYGAYRYRVTQLLNLERVRTRIAHDLHDDIGANLTRISILSEVAKQQQLNGATAAPEILDSIAAISRESVASMSDIVWAINPQHDSLGDLTSRMRRHAEEIALADGLRLNFQLQGEAQTLKLPIAMRRDLYLIFKEALNNAARHSACSVISVQMQVQSRQLELTVSDDGRGFESLGVAAAKSSDDSDNHDGNGLVSMHNRATAVGGSLTVESTLGTGTTVRLRVSLPPA